MALPSSLLKMIFGVIRMPSIVLNTTHFLDEGSLERKVQTD
jgi:hypothetical protein